ncbi:autotransporter domain-containing protein [Entomomonas asaccharolytica]|uniref:Autotransporter domain-containing protein n=1 Tax=Entomomonas asaccharolytica TaxID=2785331 RepID=A0A974NEF0_9GAMM|nr:autotransporter domain-containing protein [Entomomonas asaccharolytica]QQP84983.1 autotransporter domain-containing protein [Entomomonas asaccharolytica]
MSFSNIFHKVVLISVVPIFSASLSVKAQVVFTDEDSLRTALQNSATTSGSIQLTPKAKSINITTGIDGSSGASNFILDGQTGRLTGNNTVAIINMGTNAVNSVQNIEINNGNSASTGGALTAGSMSNGIINSAFRNNVSVNGGGAVYIANDLSGGIKTNIHFDSNKTTNGDGGGIYVGNSFSGGIQGVGGDTHFDSNQASGNGGGMYVGNDFSGDISANYFATNSAGGDGGGLYVGNNLDGTLSSYSFFINNTAGGNGAGLYVGGTLATINGAIVNNNTATGSGGGIWTGSITNQVTGNFNDNTATNGSGGALHVDNGDIGGGIINSSFNNNTAGTSGGAINLANGSVTGGVVGSQFTNNKTNTDNGGAINLDNGDITGDINNSSFQSNAAGGDGGAVNITAGNITGSIINSNFTGNTSVGNGGGLNLASGNIDGSINKTNFINNKADGSGGGFAVNGNLAGIDSAEITNNIAGADGGGFSVTGVLNNGITNSNFYRNQSDGDGGAGSIGTLNGGISNSTFSLNSAVNGGALSVDSLNGNINNSTFSFNTASGNGGAIYVANGGTFSLSADAGKSTIFTNNADGSGNASNNSFYFNNGGNMSIIGSGSVFLYDPITVANGNFSLEHATSDSGLFYWGGKNDILGGTADINFSTGATQFRPDYTLVAHNGSQMDVTLGANERFSIYLADRDPNLAIFDYSGASSSSVFNIEAGTTVSSPKSLLAQVGRYLMVKDLDPSQMPTQAELEAINIIHNTNESFKAIFEIIGNDIWLTMEFNPNLAGLSPDGDKAINSIEDWLHNTNEGLTVLTRDFDRIRNDVNSIPPEAAITLGQVSMNTHVKLARNSLDMAFSHCGENNLLLIDKNSKRCEDENFYVWGGYIGSFDQSARNLGGYSGYDARTNGFIGGVTLKFDENWSAGGYAGYTKTDTNFRELSADADSKAGHFGIFGRYSLANGFHTTLDLAYSYHDNDMKRYPGGLAASKGNFKQNIYSVGLELAYDIEPWKNGRLTPFVAGRQVWMHQQCFTEHSGAINAKVQNISTDFFTTNMGARLAQDFAINDKAVVSPNIMLGWRSNYGPKKLTTSASLLSSSGPATAPFEVKSRKQEQNALMMGVGLKTTGILKSGNSWAVNVSYNREEYAHASDDALVVGFEYKF